MFDTLNKEGLNRIIFVCLIGLSLLVYGLTLAPTVLLADAGEFQFVPWLPGIAHPTGYPLYVLLGWLFSHLLSAGEIAWRLNLFSAVTGAITIGIVYLISQQLTTCVSPKIPPSTHRLTAAGAALIFAFSHTFWSQALVAEVYAMHALFVALVMWSALRLPQSEGEPLTFKTGWPPALILGLSLTHHRTMALMIPALALYLWLSGWRRIHLTEAVKLILVALLPGLLYLYLPLIAPHTPYAQINLSPNQTLTLYDNTLVSFLDHILGRVFGGEVRPSAIGPDRLSLSLELLRQQVGWFGGLLALVGLGSLFKRPALLALTLGSFFGFLLFNLIYFIGDIYVLFIPCWLILSLWIGLGWFNLAAFLCRRFIEGKRARAADTLALTRASQQLEAHLGQLVLIILTGLLLLFPLTLLVTRYAELDQSHNTIARDAWLEILNMDLPQDAILLSNDRNEMMPMWYYQYVEGRRPDLIGLFPLITTDPTVADVGGVLDQALGSGRPIYLVKPMAGLEIKADLQPLPPLPHAQLVGATPPKRAPDQPTDFTFGDKIRLLGFDQTEQDDGATVTLYWQATGQPIDKNYTSYVHLVDSQGQGRAQSGDHQPGGVYYPTELWKPDETLRDAHTLTIPRDLPAGQYRLITGLYHQPQPGVIEPLGEPQMLTMITVQ